MKPRGAPGSSSSVDGMSEVALRSTQPFNRFYPSHVERSFGVTMSGTERASLSSEITNLDMHGLFADETPRKPVAIVQC